MKILRWSTDGGRDSHVKGLFLVEIKPWFSVVLLRFRDGTREAYHSHAFNAVTWFLKGQVEEHRISPSNPSYPQVTRYKASLKPKITRMDNMHKVFSRGNTWALSFRGPWKDTWEEYLPASGEFITLTNGRKVVSRRSAITSEV